MRLAGWMFVCVLLVPPVSAAQEEWPTKQWPSAAPASVGLDPQVLARLDADIKSGKFGYVDSMLVIRRGHIAFERSYTHDYASVYGEQAKTKGPLNAHDPSGPYNYFNPWWHPYFHGTDLHTMQSVTKSVTSVVIGAAVLRRAFPSLDTPVLTFFDTATVANVDDRKRRMTLRHLLTMTSGLDWNEDLPYADAKNDSSLMEASYDWVQYAINKPMAHEPGTVFKYSSGVTMLLSRIFRTATGTDIEEYAHRHVFAPLGIERSYWKRSPSGLVDTEGGLYLGSHDVAKIAYLYLRNGTWDGQRIVSPEWVTASVSASTPATNMLNGQPSASDVSYGYQWWVYPYGDAGRVAWGGLGLGGQRPIVVPEYDLVMVFTGWNLLPGAPGLSPRVALDRVLEAVVK